MLPGMVLVVRVCFFSISKDETESVSTSFSLPTATSGVGLNVFYDFIVYFLLIFLSGTLSSDEDLDFFLSIEISFFVVKSFLIELPLLPTALSGNRSESIAEAR